MPTERRFFFSKVHVVSAAQNHECLYTMKIRARMKHWSIVEFVFLTLRKKYFVFVTIIAWRDDYYEL